MRNHRMPDNFPLRTVVVTGNLMAAALEHAELEHAELYESMEIDSLIQAWKGAIARAGESCVPAGVLKSGNTLINGLEHRSTFPSHILGQFVAEWLGSIDELRQSVASQQEAA